MSSYFNVNNNASSIMNSIFSSLGNNSSSKQASMLGDYYAIQNGSYYKMAKKFYANKAAGTSQASKTDTSSIAQKLEALNTNSVGNVANRYKTSSSSKVNTETMKATGDALSTLGNLMSNKLYDKISSVAEDGVVTEDYNKAAILSNVQGFVKEYNNVINKVADSSNKQTLESGVRMINQTNIYSGSLQAIGIHVGSDNQLTLDEEAFAKADMKAVKAMFSGTVSYGKNIQNRMMELYSAESMSQTAVSGLYNSNAVSQLSVGSLFDGMF